MNASEYRVMHKNGYNHQLFQEIRLQNPSTIWAEEKAKVLYSKSQCIILANMLDKNISKLIQI